MRVDLPDETASTEIAKSLAHILAAPLVLTFRGEIGAGKTTIIRAMLRELGITSAIKSPTFSIVESYTCKSFQLHHFDLYRIHDEMELDYIGFRDYFADDAICCIEWPERAIHYLDEIDMEFSLSTKGVGRELCVSTFTPTGKKILSHMGK